MKMLVGCEESADITLRRRMNWWKAKGAEKGKHVYWVMGIIYCVVITLVWKSAFSILSFLSDYSKNETPSQPLPDNEFRKLSETEWKQKLTPEQYHVCREKGTETPFTGAYVNTKQEGLYTCVACGAPVFESETKFDSGSGWPSFYQQYKENDGNQSVLTKADQSLGMVRTEVLCAQCDSHLGHVFPDGPQPTGQRYCINSAALNFKPKTPESK